MTFPDTPARELFSLGLAVAAIVAWMRGTRRFSRGLRAEETEPLEVVRGFRGWIVATGLLFLAGGIFFRTAWPVLFGLVFLLEEIVETGVMIFALRRERARERGSGPTPRS